MTTEQDAHDAAIERVMRRISHAVDEAKQYTVAQVRWNDSFRQPEQQPSSANAVNAFNAVEAAIRTELKEAAAQGRREALALQKAGEHIIDLWQTDCIKPGKNDAGGFELGAAIHALRLALWPRAEASRMEERPPTEEETE